MCNLKRLKEINDEINMLRECMFCMRYISTDTDIPVETMVLFINNHKKMSEKLTELETDKNTILNSFNSKF